LVLLK